MGLRSCMFISTILVLLATLLQSLESKAISPVSSFDSVKRSSRSAECLRGIDGSCEPIVEEQQEVARRQTNCDPHTHLNCRLTIGKKSDIEEEPVLVSGSLDCYSPANRNSILCKITKLREKNTAECTSEECLISPLKRDGKKTKEKAKTPCDSRSPLCYTTFPGKRLGQQDQVPPRVTDKRQATDAPLPSTREDDKECNPKRNYFCRYRIPGKRSKVIESNIKEIVDEK